MVEDRDWSKIVNMMEEGKSKKEICNYHTKTSCKLCREKTDTCRECCIYLRLGKICDEPDSEWRIITTWRLNLRSARKVRRRDALRAAIRLRDAIKEDI